MSQTNRLSEAEIKRIISNFGVSTPDEFQSEISPNKCWFCRSTKIILDDYTDEEAIWKCKECGKRSAIPYNFREEIEDPIFYF